MRIQRIFLEYFRNYQEIDWSPHSRFNIITGDNAQGKTNLLEAVFFCTAGRSFRTARDREIVNWDKEECHARAVIEKNKASQEIEATLYKSGRTVFAVNGVKQGRGKIFRPCLALSFTPVDLDLIRGSPSERRKWLDLEIGPFDYEYLFNLEKYERVLSQRNNLLKKNTGQPADEIEPWNEQIVFYGSRLIYSRINLLKNLFPHLKQVFGDLTSGKEEISFNYLSSLPLEKGMGQKEIEALYKDTVRKKIAEEIDRQQTLLGPHRDDIIFMINRTDARKYGSRGQLRSVVLALKLSLIRMFLEEYQEYPVLVLDDVFLELDSSRRRGLDRLLEGEGQVFITSNREIKGYFSGDSRTYRVEEGKLYGGDR
ncbi:MAG: DNA replication/repair protein RecF [Actinobacteria bacterium]|nr:DNA replication/repair protein RecF [Actinomycetota bacterium]